MKKGFLCRLFVAVSLVFFQVSPGVSGELDRFANLEGKIDIAGGTAHIPVMNDAARAIMSKYPQLHITVAGGGSGVGIQKVGEGLVEIGNAGRAVSDKEKAQYQGLISYPFAVDGVTTVVHPKNATAELTSAQAQDIFAGKITNWKEVGGADADIHVYSRDEASGTRDVFWKKCLNKGAVIDSANIVSSNGAMKTAISQDPQAIGYISIGHVDETVKAVTLNGVAPTQENAINGTYTVVRKLYMNTMGTPTPLTQAFIDYILGPEGAVSIRSHGYIPMH